MKMREILWAAVASPCGVEVASNDLEATKRKFYSERAKAREEGNFEFDCLQMVSPPPDVTGKLWIVHHAKESGKKEALAGAEESPLSKG